MLRAIRASTSSGSGSTGPGRRGAARRWRAPRAAPARRRGWPGSPAPLPVVRRSGRCRPAARGSARGGRTIATKIDDLAGRAPGDQRPQAVLVGLAGGRRTGPAPRPRAGPRRRRFGLDDLGLDQPGEGRPGQRVDVLRGRRVDEPRLVEGKPGGSVIAALTLRAFQTRARPARSADHMRGCRWRRSTASRISVEAAMKPTPMSSAELGAGELGDVRGAVAAELPQPLTTAATPRAKAATRDRAAQPSARPAPARATPARAAPPASPRRPGTRPCVEVGDLQRIEHVFDFTPKCRQGEERIPLSTRGIALVSRCGDDAAGRPAGSAARSPCRSRRSWCPAARSRRSGRARRVDSVTSAAPSCDSSCSIVRGPMIGAVTAGCCQHERQRQVDQRQAGVLGQQRRARRRRRACAGWPASDRS